MKRTRPTAEQIIRKLKTAEQLIAQCKTVVGVCRIIEVMQPTYHRSRQQYGGIQAGESQTADSTGTGERSALAEGFSEGVEASGGGQVGEGDALAAGFCEAVRPCRRKLLSPERRRRAVTVVQERYRASERLSCRVVGQHRSTQRHGGKVVDLEETKLRQRLREIAAEHIRWCRRMAYRLLRREGWTVNYMRVQRPWREEGLQRPTRRKSKWTRPADGLVRRHRAEHPYQVWAMDFQFDATADGRRLKFLNVIDEHSRLCLAIRVGRRARPRTWWRCLRSSPASTRRQRSSGRTTGRSSLPRSYGTGARPAPPPAPPTSRLDPPGRTDSRSRMSSARLRLQRPLPG